MIIIRNNIIPFKGFAAMNFCGILFARKDARLTDIVINHEQIHTEQIKETLVIGFYAIYVLNWLYNLFKYGTKGHAAYRNILFEKEAYEHEYYTEYIKTRRRYEWIRT